MNTLFFFFIVIHIVSTNLDWDFQVHLTKLQAEHEISGQGQKFICYHPSTATQLPTTQTKKVLLRTLTVCLSFHEPRQSSCELLLCLWLSSSRHLQPKHLCTLPCLPICETLLTWGWKRRGKRTCGCKVPTFLPLQNNSISEVVV